MHRLVVSGDICILNELVSHFEAGARSAVVQISDEARSPFSQETGFVVNGAGAEPGTRLDALTEDLVEQGLVERVDRTSRTTSPGCRLGENGLRYLSPA